MAAFAAMYPEMRARTDRMYLLEDSGPELRATPPARVTKSAEPSRAEVSADPRTVSGAAKALRDGCITSVELTRAAMERIDRDDERLGCFLARFDDSALAAAEAADRAFAAGLDLGPLQGIPIGIKDLLLMREGPTTAQSLILQGSPWTPEDAPAVAALRDGGAVLLGKLTLSEFACGAPDPTSGFPVPRNPWNEEHWPGGSSAGTAVGIAAGMFPAGLGSDTGGSIRIPAALCGITGFKPSFGRVTTRGCIPLAPSLDTVGPMARTARDCALLLQVLAGPPVPGSNPSRYEAALDGSVAGVRIGVERSQPSRMPSLDHRLVECVDAAVERLEQGGSIAEDVAFPFYDEAMAAAFVTMAAEAFAYHRNNLRARWSEYGRTTRAILAQGALYSSSDYVQAQNVRARVAHEVGGLFRHYDVLVTPTVGCVAPRLEDDYLSRVMPVLLTPVWNLLGHPVASIPVGFVDDLPVGMQIIGRPSDEATVLKVADAYQRMTDWHLQEAPRADWP